MDFGSPLRYTRNDEFRGCPAFFSILLGLSVSPMGFASAGSELMFKTEARDEVKLGTAPFVGASVLVLLSARGTDGRF
jgi:hypothetical protein